MRRFKGYLVPQNYEPEKKCSRTDCFDIDSNDCKQCILHDKNKHILKEYEMPNKPPKLESGMIVGIQYPAESSTHYGIIAGEQIFYSDRGYDNIKTIGERPCILQEVYNGTRGGFRSQFKGLSKDRLLWKREDAALKEELQKELAEAQALVSKVQEKLENL